MMALSVGAQAPLGHAVYSWVWRLECLSRIPCCMDPDSILVLARQLDPAALGQIHDRHYAEVFRYVAYRVGEPHVREDITSEVFLRLLGALQRGRGPRENLRGWLLGTASHLVSDHYRERFSRGTVELDEQQPDHGESPAAAAERAHEELRVRRAMHKLTQDQQHVLALRFSEERSLEDTAQMMGRSIGAVKVLQFRALAALRRALGEEDAGHAD